VHAGLTVATEVRQSRIPGAGCGRFALEPVKKGALVRRLLMVDGSATSPPHQIGTTVLCRNAADLARNHQYEDASGVTNVEQMANFGGVPHNAPDDDEAIYHLVPCNFINHAAGSEANVIAELSELDPLHLRVVALRNIAAGEELYQDYRTFKTPAWFKEWCAARGTVDVQTFAFGLAADGAEAPVTCTAASSKGASSDSELSTVTST